jgi:hypothetical protein
MNQNATIRGTDPLLLAKNKAECNSSRAGLPGENVIDYGGFDSPFDGGARIKRDVASTTEATLISAAMNLEGILTVPNNAWNPTTPNLFDFIASKVTFGF